MSQHFVAEATVRVRYAETDMMGIVHHGSYIVYFEEARSHYARERGQSYREFEEEGYYLAVTQVQVRYHKPALYDQLLRIRVWMPEVKSRGVTFAYEILNSETNERLVTGESSHICLDKNGNVTRLPDSWRAWSKT